MPATSFGAENRWLKRNILACAVGLLGSAIRAAPAAAAPCDIDCAAPSHKYTLAGTVTAASNVNVDVSIPFRVVIVHNGVETNDPLGDGNNFIRLANVAVCIDVPPITSPQPPPPSAPGPLNGVEIVIGIDGVFFTVANSDADTQFTLVDVDDGSGATPLASSMSFEDAVTTSDDTADLPVLHGVDREKM